MTVFDKFLKFEFVLGIEPPKTFLYHSVWFPWSERLAGPSWRSKWSSSPILNPRYWPKKLRFASLPRSTPLVFNWSAWKEKPNIRSSSSHVFTNPESTNCFPDFFSLFCLILRSRSFQLISKYTKKCQKIREKNGLYIVKSCVEHIIITIKINRDVLWLLNICTIHTVCIPCCEFSSTWNPSERADPNDRDRRSSYCDAQLFAPNSSQWGGFFFSIKFQFGKH